MAQKNKKSWRGKSVEQMKEEFDWVILDNGEIKFLQNGIEFAKGGDSGGEDPRDVVHEPEGVSVGTGHYISGVFQPRHAETDDTYRPADPELRVNLRERFLLVS